MDKSKGHNELEKTESDLREKILDVAEGLFAEKGYAQTSIRDITKGAHCNISAANYYFHGKENLYVEVFRRHMHAIRDQRIHGIRSVLLNQTEQTTLEALLQSFAAAFLEPFQKSGVGHRLMKLMMKERNEPHLPKQIFIDEVIKPVKNTMIDALTRVCPGLGGTEADLCIHSLVGQLTHVLQARDLFDGIDKTTTPILDLPKALEHIVKFSAAGIRQYLKAGLK
ncbi:MAG: TetR/AcrR family transcriptional regulator [Deltaproteobacteria bacterium]|nr:TetR/AcrR family transcriptional regulator [Deltaproteobacteria bacterium]